MRSTFPCTRLINEHLLLTHRSQAYRHLWVWWALGEPQLCACALEDVGRAPAPGAARYDGENWYRGAPPLAAPRGEGEGGAAEPGPTARWVSLEYALPRAALAELVATLGSAGFLAASGCAGKTLELKFVGGPGRAEQGVNADGPVVCANVLWLVALPAGWGRLAALERVLAGLGGRPHLGKCHGLA